LDRPSGWAAIVLDLLDDARAELFIISTVALGGVANLFLGFSILSVAEFVYWAVKICVDAFITPYK